MKNFTSATSAENLRLIYGDFETRRWKAPLTGRQECLPYAANCLPPYWFSTLWHCRKLRRGDCFDRNFFAFADLSTAGNAGVQQLIGVLRGAIILDAADRTVNRIRYRHQ